MSAKHGPNGKPGSLSTKRLVILHGLRDDNGISYRFIDRRTRDFVAALPVGCTKEEAVAKAPGMELYIHHYEEEEN